MAVLSDYLSGTITVTNGSTAFTGTGTAWRVVGFREGDTVQLQGFTAVIAGTSAADPLIESNTAGHFTEPWAGTSGTYAYRMRYLPDGARVTAQTRALIELLGNGVLYSIAELPVQEGMLLIGNASGQYVHIDRSELGIDDPHGNLAQLAAIAKANDQFIVMGADGTIELKPISDFATASQGEKADTALQTLMAGANISITGTGTVKTIEATAPPAPVTSVNTKTGAVVLNAADVGLGSVANKTEEQMVASGPISLALSGKASLTGGIFTGAVDSKIGVYSTQTAHGGWGWLDSAIAWRPGLETNHSLSFFYYNVSNGSFIGRAVSFTQSGGLQVTGTISKGGGTFLIDHPLDPINRNLRHGFVEAPRYDLIYRGKVKLVDGVATVNIDESSAMTDGTFAALTKNACVTSLQNQEGFARIKPSVISGGQFEITCEDITCTDEVSWVVIAERNDAFVRNVDENCERGTGRFIPEFDKED